MGAVVVYEGMAPIPNLTLQERVYAELRRQILDGNLEPGEVVTIRSIAGAMGTSVMPVREAVQRLAADQALVVKPNKSIRVSLLSRGGFHELSAIRKELEGLAAARAAELTNDEDLDRLDQHLVSIREAIRTRDVNMLLAENQAFAFRVQAISRSTYLSTLIGGLWLRLGPTRRIAFQALLRPEIQIENVARRREALVEALRAKNPEGARSAVVDDISSGISFILKFGVFSDANTDEVPQKFVI